MTLNTTSPARAESFDEATPFSSFVELACRRAHAQPDDRAYVFLKDGEAEVDELTYRTLDRRARAIAVQLRQCVRPGDRVLLVFPPGLDFVAAFFGCLYAGVIAVPVYPPASAADWPRFEKIALDAGTIVVCTHSSRIDAIQLAARGASAHFRENLWYVAVDNVELACAEQWRMPPIDRSSLAFLQYTSGSTGMPKGVMVSHGNLLHNESMIQRGFEHSSRTVVVGWLPLYHDMGLIGNILQPLYLGVPSILMSPAAFLMKPLRWLQAISRYRASTSGGPNFAYELCARRVTDEQKRGLDLGCWDIAFNGSEVVRADTLARFADAFASCGFRRDAFYCCYGMAETTLFVTGTAKRRDPLVKWLDADALQRHRVVLAGADRSPADQNLLGAVGCGQSPDLQVEIVDPGTARRCAPDGVGEIWVRGDSIAQGYWNNPDTTRATFRARLADSGEGPFLRTGDLGFIQDGHLFVTGRLKDLIIIRGRNYYPSDVEAAVQASHGAMKPDGAAAFSVEIDGEERLVVAQEIHRARYRDIDAQDAIGAARLAVLAQCGLPLHDVVLIRHGRLPRTSSGKIRRHACREAYQSGTLELFPHHGMRDDNCSTTAITEDRRL